jgi:Flp pilus assembly protein TadG
MANPLKKRNRDRRGSAIVEMAVVTPFLLLLTFGLLEYGWMFLKSEQITNAARSGARYAATAVVTSSGQVTGSSSPAVQFLTASGIPVQAGTVTVPTGVNPGVGNPVTVTVTVPYSSIQFTGFPGLPTPASLTASVTMAKEGFTSGS